MNRHQRVEQRRTSVRPDGIFPLLLATVIAFSAATAQEVTVTATVDSQSVLIGDWIRYSVEVKHPPSVSVMMPVFKDTIGLFDIVQQDTVVRADADGGILLKKNFVIAKYDAGNYYIQPFTVRYTDAQGKQDVAQSNPIPVEIRGVEVDTSQTIRDVKAPLTVPMSAEEIAAYVGIIAAVGGVAYGIYYYIRKRRLAGTDVPAEKRPQIPPHVAALMELEALEARRLWQAGEIKAYYSEATEIIRRYFELRFGIMALEMTTGEVMSQLDRFTLPKQTVDSIELMLTGADLVKFAKYQPVAAENEQVIAQARSIVHQTQPVVNDQSAAAVDVPQTVS